MTRLTFAELLAIAPARLRDEYHAAAAAAAEKPESRKRQRALSQAESYIWLCQPSEPLPLGTGPLQEIEGFAEMNAADRVRSEQENLPDSDF
jgi:hypothetical protein